MYNRAAVEAVKRLQGHIAVSKKRHTSYEIGEYAGNGWFKAIANTANGKEQFLNAARFIQGVKEKRWRVILLES